MRQEDAEELTARFVTAAGGDLRIAAALVYGSHAAGTADEHSDLDLGIVPADGFLDAVVADAHRIVEALGTPLLVAVFDDPGTFHITLDSGASVELIIHGPADLDLRRPHRVLFDRDGLVEGAVGAPAAAFRSPEPDDVSRQLELFWHDVEHLVTALGRGDRWWAFGQLDEVRRLVIGLMRVEAGAAIEDEAYWKLDSELPADRLSALQLTVAPLELAPMREAASALLELYRSVGRSLATGDGVRYPEALDQLMAGKLAAIAESAREGEAGRR